MVSESLKLTLNLLTVILVKSSLDFNLRIGDVICSELECIGIEQFLRLSENDKMDLYQFFFQDFITTCIEKHCTVFVNNLHQCLFTIMCLIFAHCML